MGWLIDGMLNERLLGILSTKENVNMETLGFTAGNSEKYYAIVTPVDISGERFGTTIAYRQSSPYGLEDRIWSNRGEFGNASLCQ